MLWRHSQQRAYPVYDPPRALALTRMLQGVIEHGTGKRAAIGRPAAGKTGTTSNNRDAWFAGYTPDYAAADLARRRPQPPAAAA